MTAGDHSLDESSLRDDFQEGLEALREVATERPYLSAEDVRPVARNGTDVIVRLGIWPTDRYPVDFRDEEYEVFVAIPERFPTGGGKGLAAAPPLDRSDQALNNNSDWDDGMENAIKNSTAVDSVEAYSYNWKNASMNDAEDMARFLSVADEFLSTG